MTSEATNTADFASTLLAKYLKLNDDYNAVIAKQQQSDEEWLTISEMEHTFKSELEEKLKAKDSELEDKLKAKDSELEDKLKAKDSELEEIRKANSELEEIRKARNSELVEIRKERDLSRSGFNETARELERENEKLRNEIHRMKQREESYFDPPFHGTPKPQPISTMAPPPQVIVNLPPQPSITPFTGNNNWEEFYAEFRSTADHFQWNRAECCHQLKLCMKANAHSFVFRVCSEEQRCSYTMLVDALERHYKDRTTPHVHLLNLQNIKFNMKDPVSEYVLQIKRGIRKAFPGLDSPEGISMRKTIELSYFQQGIVDPNLSKELNLLSDITSIEAARSYVERYISVVGTKFNRVPIQSTIVEWKDEDKIPEIPSDDPVVTQSQLTKIVCAAVTKVCKALRPWKTKNNRICYQCRCVGHFVNNCPQPQLSA